MDNHYIPELARIVQIQTETYDTKSFELALVEPPAKENSDSSQANSWKLSVWVWGKPLSAWPPVRITL